MTFDPAELDFMDSLDKQEEIWQATKRAIRAQRDIMERAQWTIERLERQLDALGEARIAFKEFRIK
tara:strand:- start:4968 stop:5165 length:198 start_codon:yes stop_codon:yes gene_type:complete